MSVYNTYTAIMRFELVTNLPLYWVAFCLRRARSSHRRSGGAVVAEALLGEGLRILTEETGTEADSSPLLSPSLKRTSLMIHVTTCPNAASQTVAFLRSTKVRTTAR